MQAAEGGGFEVCGDHTYTEAATYTITTQVTDDGGETTTLTATITVSDPNVTITATEGSQFSGTVAAFSGSASQATSASIDWGDNTDPTPGTITSSGSSTFTVSGSHTYAEEDDYTVTVTVQMNSGGPLTVSNPASVADADLQSQGENFSGTAGTPLATPPAQVLVATFTDANPQPPLSDFSALIDWGDGTTDEGTVEAEGANTFDVLGNHVYADAGTYPVTTTIDDIGGSTTTANGTATIGLQEGQVYNLSVTLDAPTPPNGGAVRGYPESFLAISCIRASGKNESFGTERAAW